MSMGLGCVSLNTILVMFCPSWRGHFSRRWNWSRLQFMENSFSLATIGLQRNQGYFCQQGREFTVPPGFPARQSEPCAFAQAAYDRYTSAYRRTCFYLFIAVGSRNSICGWTGLQLRLFIRTVAALSHRFPCHISIDCMWFFYSNFTTRQLLSM